MVELNGLQIFGLICVGFIVGYVSDLVYTKYVDQTLIRNLLLGVISSLTIGIIANIIGLGSELGYAFVGTLGITFIAHVFDMPQTSQA